MPDARDAEFLRQYLADHDASCPSCGYNLRSLATDRCPECGDAIELRIGLVHPRQAAFITGLIGIAMGAGFSGLLLIYVLIVVLLLDRGGPPSDFMAIVLCGAIAQGAALAAWIALSRRIRLWSGPLRWGLAMLGWCMSAVNVVVFSLNIR